MDPLFFLKLKVIIELELVKLVLLLFDFYWELSFR